MKSYATARLYLWSNSLFRKVHGGLQALFEGLWMGTLSTSAVDAISQVSYGSGSDYTNEAYLDSGFRFWEDLAISRYFPPGCRVLVAAAGGGREVIALTRAGFYADGFECSAPMVATGQRALRDRGIAGLLEFAPPCTAPVTNRLYDAVIVGWNGYTYMLPRERRIAFLISLRGRLKPGGHLLLSGAVGSAGRADIWTPRIANAVRLLTARDVVFETGDRFPGRPRHVFTRRQLRDELSGAGFRALDYWGWGPFGAVMAIHELPAACAAHAGQSVNESLSKSP